VQEKYDLRLRLSRALHRAVQEKCELLLGHVLRRAAQEKCDCGCGCD
jgi:DNA-nicking Smr family endonuclease